MRRTAVIGVVYILLGFVVFYLLIAVSFVDARRQDEAKPTAVDQRWKVVRTNADGLEAELKKLNAEGYQVSLAANVRVVGSEILVVVNEGDTYTEEETDEQ